MRSDAASKFANEARSCRTRTTTTRSCLLSINTPCDHISASGTSSTHASALQLQLTRGVDFLFPSSYCRIRIPPLFDIRTRLPGFGHTRFEAVFTRCNCYLNNKLWAPPTSSRSKKKVCQVFRIKMAFSIKKVTESAPNLLILKVCTPDFNRF